MTQYADPTRCPDCTSALPSDAEACPTCALPLRGPLAGELYSTLARADQLLTQLRALVGAPVLLPAVAAPPPQAPLERRAPRRSALSSATVPQLLLGLGALCLLVAALVFLAVTWSVMGVGGRTATLLALTSVSSGVSALLARKGLRGATEALGLVTLGLVALDVAGAYHAGWFGDLGAPSFLVVVGAVLLLTATTACLAVRRTPARSFTAGQAVVVLGWCLVTGGIDLDGSTGAGGALLAVLLAAAGAVAAVRLALRVAAVGVGSVTGLAWLVLAETGLGQLGDDLTVHHVWGDLAAWPLVTAALLLGALALVRTWARVVREAALSVSTAVLVLVVVSPALDNGATAATLAVLAALAPALAVAGALPRPWSSAALVTAVVGTAVAAVESLALADEAADRLQQALTSGGPWSGRLPAAATLDGLQPWLLLPDAGLVVLAALVLCRLLGRTAGARPAVEVAVLTAVAATAVLHPVPVWTLVAGLLVAGVALLVLDDLVPAVVSLAAATVVATYSDGLLAVALGTVLVAAATLHLRDRREPVTTAAGVVAALSLAASVWSWGDLLDRPGQWTAVVGIAVLALVALVHRGAGVEVGAATGVTGLALLGLSEAPAELLPTWAAVYLTLAGAATCTQAVLREDRRRLSWAGGLLLAAASWVRLADIGVHAPEPYTLPAAVALLVLGVVQLRRRSDEDTLRALGPGLGLALTPSLLWVLEDPTTLRSLMLGVACLVLVAAGLRLQWTAPLVFGVAVGAAIVLRSAAPHIGEAVPRWATIGTAGVLLVALGVTWEQRVREARVLIGHVRQLR